MFKRKEHFGGPSILMPNIIDNSDTIKMGAMVKLRNGDLEAGVAAQALHGVVVDIVDKLGNSVFGSLAELGGATVTGTPSSGSVTVASDNETVDQITARIETSKQVIYSADVTGTMNTTLSSDKPGGWVDIADDENVDETTHTRTITGGGQLKNWGVDPEDSTRMLVSINESEAWDTADPMTA